MQQQREAEQRAVEARRKDADAAELRAKALRQQADADAMRQRAEQDLAMSEHEAARADAERRAAAEQHAKARKVLPDDYDAPGATPVRQHADAAETTEGTPVEQRTGAEPGPNRDWHDPQPPPSGTAGSRPGEAGSRPGGGGPTADQPGYDPDPKTVPHGTPQVNPHTMPPQQTGQPGWPSH